MRTLLTGALLLLGSSLEAATYYLDVSHPAASDASTGAIGSPYRTLGRAVRTLSPGDTLYIRKGIYREKAVEIDARGTASAPIRLIGEPGVIFRGTQPIGSDGFIRAGGFPSVYSTQILTFEPARVVETNVARWRPIPVADPNGVAFDLARPVAYQSVDSIAEVQAVKGSFYWDAAAKRLYIQTFDAGDPRNNNYDLEAGASYDGVIKVRGNYVTLESVRVEYSRLMQLEGASFSTLRGIELDGVPLYVFGSTGCVVDGLFSENVIARGNTHEWHNKGSGTALAVFENSTSTMVRNAIVVRGWNGVSSSGTGTRMENVRIWGFPNHGLGATGTNSVFERITVWNAQDAVYMMGGRDVTLQNSLFYEAIHIRNASAGITLRNNVVFGGVFVTADSTSGFDSDYNLFIVDGLDDYALGKDRVKNLDAVRALGQESNSVTAGAATALFLNWPGRLIQHADLTPIQGSLVVDSGDPAYPPPPGGGSRVDIGPEELDASSSRRPRPPSNLRIMR